MPITDLHYIEVHIVEHCNLNCAHCLHFSPLAEKKFINLENLKNDLICLSKFTNLEGGICLMGGEPLLNKEILNIISIVRDVYPIIPVTILTNGILLNSIDDVFFLTCNKNNINLEISAYPIKIPFKDIIKKCRKFNVKLHLHQVSLGEGIKLDADVKIGAFSKLPLDINGEGDSEKNWNKCPIYCPQLCNGKLYRCCTSAYIAYFNKFFNKNLHISSRDFIDIYNITKDGIKEFFSRPLDFCKYCKIDKIENNLGWSRTTYDIKEWI